MRRALALIALSSCAALVDLDSLSSGDAGQSDADASNAADVQGEVCVPHTCEVVDANCGPVPDGCGKFIVKGGNESCGSCTNGLTCGAVKDYVCGSLPLYSGVHTENDCKIAGGVVRGVGAIGDAGAQSVCELGGNQCPANWIHLANWGSTSASSSTPCGCSAATCTTTSHTFSNKPTETCSVNCLTTTSQNNCTVIYGMSGATANLITIGCY